MWSATTSGTTLWVVVSTAALTPIVFCVYHVVLFVAAVRRRGRAVDQFPHDAKHWFWGHLHKVGLVRCMTFTAMLRPSRIFYT